MLKHNEKIYDSFQYSIARAKALLALQDGIDIMLELNVDEGDIFQQLMGKIPVVSELTNIIGLPEIMNDVVNKMVEGFESLDESDVEKRIDDYFATHSKEELEMEFSPLKEMIESLDMIYQKPLYHEAVTSAVNAFETYMRDTMIDLISKNEVIEKRFYPLLDNLVSYKKLKKYDYDPKRVLGHLVADTINFYNLNEVDKNYQKALGKTKTNFTILGNEERKRVLQNFIYVRHLVVHNSGLVDAKFVKETGYKYKIGMSYPVRRRYVENTIDTIIKIIETIEMEIKKQK
jgi:hypothetical protein